MVKFYHTGIHSFKALGSGARRQPAQKNQDLIYDNCKGSLSQRLSISTSATSAAARIPRRVTPTCCLTQRPPKLLFIFTPLPLSDPALISIRCQVGSSPWRLIMNRGFPTKRPKVCSQATEPLDCRALIPKMIEAICRRE